MIATENQYRVTSRKLDKLRRALDDVKDASVQDSVFVNAQVLSLSETVQELEEQLAEYEALRSGNVAEIPVNSLADLPKALIKARVARGFSQSDLAGMLGLRPQQIQRWESEEYASVSFASLARIANVLKLDTRQNVLLDDRPAYDPKELRRALMDAGLPASVLDTRILPRRLATRLDMFIDELDARLRKLFAFGIREVLSHREFAPTALQFKLPASAKQVRTRAYAAYLDGLCSIVAKAVRRQPSPLPGSIEDMHAQLFFYGLSLQSAVEACWEMGIAVIALDDRIAFNGACWRRNGRAVIVLRNTGDEESRALFDLIHELYHLIATEGDFAMIEAEETSSERRESREEQRANRFAAEVLTEGRLATIISEFLQRSNGQVSLLSEAAIEIADEENIPVGILANLFAAHVDKENSNRSWWAAARLLQEPGDPWRTVRDVFIRNAELDRLDRVEKDLINQMLETSDERTDGQT